MIQQPGQDFPIVDKDGATIDQYQGWINSVTQLLNFLEIAEGNGSPEGVVTAKKKKLYFNLTGGAGTTVYIKTTNELVNTGWLAIG